MCILFLDCFINPIDYIRRSFCFNVQCTSKIIKGKETWAGTVLEQLCVCSVMPVVLFCRRCVNLNILYGMFPGVRSGSGFTAGSRLREKFSTSVT